MLDDLLKTSQKQRNDTNSFELMAFFWHGNSASVRVQNVPKAFETFQNPSNVCDSHDDRFLETAQISLKRCRFPQIGV